VDVQRYISSGILESYVFGMLPEAEHNEVEAVVLQYPEIKAAVNLLQQDKERFVQLYAVAPPPGVKDRLIEIIRQENEEEDKGLLPEELRDPAAPAVKRASDAPAPGLPPKSSKEHIYKYAAAAIIILLLGSIVMNFVFFHKSTDYKSRYKALIATKEKLDAEKERQALTSLKTPKPDADPLTSPEFKWTKMQGSGAYAGKSVSVGWNARTQAVYLQAHLMPAPPAGKQFQLWAIVNRKLVDIGVFKTGDDVSGQLQEMKALAVAQGFAVTLEKTGSSGPSMDQVCMSARISR
jgi:anti-sigma-K factor RskA